MSLQVWLPLDGRLDNFGLADITVTNYGATVDNNGKIGKCYNFNGTNSRIRIDNIPKPKDLTVAFWMKRNSTTNSRQFLFNSWPGFSIELTVNNTLFGYLAEGAGRCNYSEVITENTGWIHVCYTVKDKVNTNLYINGQKVATCSFNSSINWGTQSDTNIEYLQGGYYGNGKINDVRIYDHCLSAKEVKEISKGLVRHYPLNEMIGNPNLLKSEPKSHNESGYGAYELALSENLINGNVYTLQLWDIYNYNTGSSSSIWVYWGGGYNNLAVITGFTPNNIYKSYVSLTFTANINTSSQQGSIDANNAWLILYNVPNSTKQYMKVGKWKLEEGSEATPWVPNVNDVEYSSYNLGNVVYDCSGYGRNGSLSPTPPTYGSQSPRYFNCMAFNGTNNYIDCGLSGDGNLPTDAITVCGWGYRDNWNQDKRIISCTQGGGFNFEVETDRFIIYRNGGYLYAHNDFSKTSGWYFLTGTYDGYIAKCYINGQLKGSSTANSTKYPITYNTAAKLFIGCEPSTSTPTAPFWNGKISDIRIYCTALSAQDIKELYQSSLSVDNMGNFHTHEIFENTEAQS